MNCSVRYSGRGDTTLDKYDRVVIIKNDGAVSVHSGDGIKPLNYMGPKAVFKDTHEGDERVMIFDSARENLKITVHQLYEEITWEVGDEEPGLQRDGTEADLQEWLSQNIEQVGNLEFVNREHPTSAGPVDIYARDKETGDDVLIEVKRVASSSAVYQIRRYLEGHENSAHGMIVALDVRPRTRKLADKHGITWVEIDKPKPAEERVETTSVEGEC